MLFVPIWDMNRLKRVKYQYVTVGLIFLNALVYFVFETHLLLQEPGAFLGAFALKPRDVSSIRAFVDHAPDQFHLLTYMFVHGSVWHLVGNMVFLYVFGDNVEDALGHLRFIVFYLLCGVIAALVHSVVTVSPDSPLIGASGAVAGVIGAYVILHPNVRVWVLFPVPIIPFLPLRISAGFVIGVWLIYQIASGIFFNGEATAWWAHVGGFFAGALLVILMRRRGVRLFDGSTGIEEPRRMSKGAAD
jgi:membrane associated rhomboid family serine protease